MDLLTFSDRTVDSGQALGPVNRITNELTEVADNLAVVESFSHVWVVKTGDGLVLFDTSAGATGPKVVNAVRRWCTDPVHSIVYTHGHVDHVGGATAWIADAESRQYPRPRFVGHENVGPRLQRYQRTNGYNLAINNRQFAPSRRLGAATTDKSRSFVPPGTPEPDLEYRLELTLDIGGDQFVLHHGKGETDDHTWTEWVGHDTVFTGDLLVWNFPNCGNPQKVLRFPAEWAAAMRAMDATSPHLVAPAHGLPVRGTQRTNRVLTSVAEALEHLIDGVITLLNNDATLDEAIHTVKVPAELLQLPWMRPFYDEPEFVVHNIWRTYGGWWGGNPAKLLPAREVDLAVEVAALAGGVTALATRAAALLSTGDLRLAAELIEMAAAAEPTNGDVHAVRSQVYAQRRADATSLMSKGIFEAAARHSAQVAGIAVPEMTRTRVLS